MRKLLWVLAVLATLIAAGWYLAEGWLAGRVQRELANQPQMRVAAVSPLRQLPRFGLRLEGLALASDGVQADVPELDVWATPWWVGSINAAMPPEFRAGPEGAMLPVSLTQGQVGAYFSPLHGMALGRAQLMLDNVAVAGRPVIGKGDLSARLVVLGGDAPRAARASYALRLSVQRLALSSLTGTGGPGLPGENLGLSGPVTVWLDAAPGRGMLTGTATRPGLVGFDSPDGVMVTLDDLTALIRGRVQADAAGFAAGQAMIYTRDARALIARLVAAGWLDARAGLLAGAALTGIGSAGPVKGDPFPPAQDGEIRLPLSFADGQARLGPLPLGPAPRLR